MTYFAKRLFMGFLVLAVVVSSACGGGGGGSSSDSTSTSSDPFSVSPASLTFQAKIGENLPASKTITVTANTSNVEIPTVTFTGAALTSVDVTSQTSTAMTLLVTVPDPDVVGVGTHTGTITIKNSALTKTVAVSYEVAPAPAVIGSVSPYVGMAGQAGTVMIGGSGFSNIAGMPTVMFGATQATSAEVISDAEIVAHYPALAAGSYNVTISGSVAFTSSATLKVITPPAYAALASSSSGKKSKVVEDAEHGRLFVANITAQTIERYTYNPSLGWSKDSVSLPGVYDVALQPGGSRLLAVAAMSVYAIDPVATTMAPALVTTATGYGICGERLGNIEFTTTGKALVLRDIPECTGGIDGYILDSADTLTPIMSFWLSAPTMNYIPVVGSSATGKVLLTDSDWVANFNAFLLNLEMTTLPSANKIAVNSDATVIAVESSVWDGLQAQWVYSYEVYNGAYLSLGSFTPGVVLDAMAISPDGTRLYGYDATSATVTTYDLTTTTGGNFLAIGAPSTLGTNPGVGSTLRVSQDGQTLIFGGSSYVMSVPVSTL